MSYSFWDTAGGQRFTEGTVPLLIEAIDKLAKELNKANTLAEQRKQHETSMILCKIITLAEAEECNLKKFKTLWTSYCYFNDYTVQCNEYDVSIKKLW